MPWRDYSGTEHTYPHEWSPPVIPDPVQGEFVGWVKFRGELVMETEVKTLFSLAAGPAVREWHRLMVAYGPGAVDWGVRDLGDGERELPGRRG